MFDNVKRQWALGRVRPGDGRALQRFRWWHFLTGRKLLYLHLWQDGRQVEYAVDVRPGSERVMAHLFADRRHSAQSPMPAVMPAAGGYFEVAQTKFGLKRAHFVSADGTEAQLVADPSSPIGRRLRLEREHPQASRVIGTVAALMLIIGVTLNLLQLAEPISEIPPLMERFGTFTSPVHLPVWMNVGLGFAAVLGSMERGLRLKYHWLLDGMAD
ncbi:hypothetical protein [Arthrobacter zhaoguopingii]|uniref:hypothetical protein n=1 Tax=Arthrobacter zhaoguopingii TaxID=2681491 RepID=UPI00135A8E06|nr:hypothetical protein [Arthrobacter zhaoguopingii]